MNKVFGLLALLFGLTAYGYCAGAGAGNPNMYYVGSSSGIIISSYTYTNVFEIKASTNFALNIDNMKFWCDDNATIQVGISSQATGGYSAVIATLRPIGVPTKNKFTAKLNVTCTDAQVSVGTSFRVLANAGFEYDESGGKLQIPKEYALIFRAQGDSSAGGKKCYGQFRVWE